MVGRVDKCSDWLDPYRREKRSRQSKQCRFIPTPANFPRSQSFDLVRHDSAILIAFCGARQRDSSRRYCFAHLFERDGVPDPGSSWCSWHRGVCDGKHEGSVDNVAHGSTY